MSNLGQVALVVVGTVVGFELGAPQLGFVLGSLAGSVLFPTQLPHGPQLTDNRTTTASVGDPVPIVFGTADVAGTVIWLAPYQQTTQHSSSKGGPQQTTYQYNQSIAIGLCEGPIGTVLRIWENGTIVYDIRPQQQANADLNLLAETDLEYSNRLTVSTTYAETFTLYLGSETQEPDPTIESVEGFGNVPAFRGLAYIVYPNRLLQTGQGWRHPSFRFEVAAQGVGDCSTVTQYANEVLYPWESGGGDPTNPQNTNTFQVLNTDSNSPQYPVAGVPAWYNVNYSTLSAALAAASANYPVAQDDFVGYAISSIGNELATSLAEAGGAALAAQYGTPDPHAIQVLYGFQSTSHLFSDFGTAVATVTTPGQTFEYGGYLYRVTGTPTSEANPGVVAPWISIENNASIGAPYYLLISGLVSVQVTRAPSAPPNPCAGLTRWSNDTDYAVNTDGTLLLCADWTLDTTQNYLVLQATAYNNGYPSSQTPSYPLGPCLPQSSGENTEAFWTAAYAAAVAAGTMAAGKTYFAGGFDATGSTIGVYPVIQNFGYTIDQTVCEGSASGVTVGAIIAAVCARAGLLSIDITDMNAISIPGYAISTVTSGSSILTPLRSVAFFDAVESQGVMRFLARGKAIAATLTTDDIGAYDASGGGADKKVPPSITTTRAQDEDLPRSIRLRYKAVSRDYEEGEQDSPFRLTTAAVNDVDVSLALCLGDTQALQCAQVIWADSWAARTAYTLSVDQAWLALDCGDCIGVPVDGVLQRMRIVSDSNASGVLRKLSCVRDDGGAYISFAVATAPQRTAQVLSFVGPSTYELMDLPCLVDADSDAGFYFAAQRQSGAGQWNGVMLYQSVDGGVSYAQLFALGTEATYGTLRAVLPASEAFTWDMTTVIDVAVANETVTFESRTDAAVLAGANAAAVGSDGRWEIVQFATATQVSSTRWTLSRLLRGRRGTEHVMGSSRTGDALVMVSTGDLERVPLQLTQVGAALGYKAVSLGAAYATGINQSFAGHAQALVPFSPVALAATAQLNGDIVMTWIRRGRLGRTLTSGIDVPLSEATEAYQVDILSDAGAVLRTLAVAVESVTYTLAEQDTDFEDAPTTLSVAVYQMSASVGRGTRATATFTLPATALPTPLVSLVVSAVATTLATDHSEQFSAVGTFTDGTSADISATVTWTSSAATIATVSSTGLVTAHAIGSATIGAHRGTITATPQAITVVAPDVVPATLVAATTALFVVESGGEYFDSPDGVTFTARGSPSPSDFPGPFLGNMTQVGDSWYAENTAANQESFQFWKITGDWWQTPWTKTLISFLPTANHIIGGFGAAGLTLPLRYLNGEWVTWIQAPGDLYYWPILTSTNFVTWTDKPVPVGIPNGPADIVQIRDIRWDATHSRYLLFGVEYNDGVGVTVTQSIWLYASTDLETFTEIANLGALLNSQPFDLTGIAQHGENLVAVGYQTSVTTGLLTPIILYSLDAGNTWALAANPPTVAPGDAASMSGVVFDGVNFVAAWNEAGVFGPLGYGHSSNGHEWTWISNTTVFGLDTNGNGAVMGTAAGVVMTSTDHGATFASHFVPP